jgi:hypothetical protein
MIYEYAVDPELVTAWAVGKDIGLAPQFGLDNRRVVADFPSNWDGIATGILLETFQWDCGDPNYIEAQNRLDALLAFMKPKVSRGQQAQNGSWITHVTTAHDKEPFHAILSRQAVYGREEVITPNVVQDLHNSRWYLPTIDVTTKTAEALAAQLAPLLRTSSSVILIDPYFKADRPSYPEVLGLLVRQAILTRSATRPKPDFTVMSGVGDRDVPAAGLPVEEQLRRESQHRCGKAKELLGPRIPKGMSVKFCCIAQFDGGDQIHNRLLLTDVGGAVIPYGTQAIGENVFDDITPLFAGQHRTRWRQYGKGEGLTIVGEPVMIDGLLD